MLRPMLFAATLTAAALTGCAGYNLRPITTGETSIESWGGKGVDGRPAKEGYIFYAPHPFLLLTPQPVPANMQPPKKPHYSASIVYLPDFQRPYRFTRYTLLAKSDLNINFKDGWMFTGAESKTDTTAFTSGLVDLAKSAVGILSQEDRTDDTLPKLFRIDFDTKDSTWKLTPVELE